ncbi:hypothetical protein [Rathayibacter rathayi]|uniref:hypothetical protein n=1 Tax=Rathayibacter rathayi TaxID=33887 RepID=UPI0011B04801|nr:hypothetical protein [Rathayibacter rathayi]
MDEITRGLLTREAMALAPVLYEALDDAVAEARGLRFAESKQPHLHSALRRAAFRDNLEVRGVPGGWTVGGNPRQSGQTILHLDGAGITLRVLSESTVTTNGVPHAGLNASRREEWHTVSVPMSIFEEWMPEVPSRALLLLMNSRSEEPTLRIVRTVAEGQYRGTVPCDYSLAMKRIKDALGHATFDTKEDDNFYATLEQEESGNA